MAVAFNYNIESIFTLGQGTAIIGWATDVDSPLKEITIKQNGKNVLTANLLNDAEIIRTQRPDVNAAFATEAKHHHGFVIWTPVLLEANKEIQITFDKNSYNKNSAAILITDASGDFLRDSHSHSGAAVYKLALKHKAINIVFTLLRTMGLNTEHQLAALAGAVDIGSFFIDRAFNLNNQGVLLLGWKNLTHPVTPTLNLLSSNNESITIDNVYPLSRPDVWEGLKKESPNASINCGFLIYIDCHIDNSAEYLLQLNFGDFSDFRKINFSNTDNNPQFIRTVLESIPSPHSLIENIYRIFGTGFGKAIGAISQIHKKTVAQYQEQQFGQAPENPSISVVIPLYGRFDFMRHQLAHFVHDADFDKVDLIYVVDDPSIKDASLNTAISYHALFQKPFRVIWYDCNLGFAGANNIGVRAARGEKLLLMNSDIIPQQPGWLSQLDHYYTSLPNVGIIGPLLQFADNSIQHAGMKAKRDPYLPGFLLNIHPGKGWEYPHTTEPSEQQLLTAACIYLSKEDYLAVGGFDEGYLIGDFEDSDLCLAIKKRGKNLWLAPGVRLWHLERQSQNIGTVSGFRQLITLYNGWRYHEKIIAGEIANPEGGNV
jgi:GT2 family glycosyltransferase